MIYQKNFVERVSIYVHPTFYRALKLTFPGDIGGLSLDDTTKSEIGQGSMERAVGVHTRVKFNAEERS